jgi:hypothetical protein
MKQDWYCMGVVSRLGGKATGYCNNRVNKRGELCMPCMKAWATRARDATTPTQREGVRRMMERLGSRGMERALRAMNPEAADYARWLIAASEREEVIA